MCGSHLRHRGDDGEELSTRQCDRAGTARLYIPNNCTKRVVFLAPVSTKVQTVSQRSTHQVSQGKHAVLDGGWIKERSAQPSKKKCKLAAGWSNRSGNGNRSAVRVHQTSIRRSCFTGRQEHLATRWIHPSPCERFDSCPGCPPNITREIQATSSPSALTHSVWGWCGPG